MPNQNSIYAPTPLAVTKGGTGNNVPWTDGQLLIGNTGTDPSVNTLTPGANVTIINGPGSISISASSLYPIPWQYLDATTTMVPFNGYITGGGFTFTLPSTSQVGDMFSLFKRSNETGAFLTINCQGVSDSILTSLGPLHSIQTSSSYAGFTIVCVSAIGIVRDYGIISTNGAVFT